MHIHLSEYQEPHLYRVVTCQQGLRQPRQWRDQNQIQFAGASRIAMRKYTIPQSMTVEYLLGDHLGSTSITTDTSGNKVSEIRYTAWGKARYTWKDPTLSTTPAYKLLDYTFTGQFSYMDDISTGEVTEGFGLMYYNARWYDPYLNRFTQPDSIVPDPTNPQAYDRYAYVNNSPLNYTDPSGHDLVDKIKQHKQAYGKFWHQYSGAWNRAGGHIDLPDLRPKNPIANPPVSGCDTLACIPEGMGWDGSRFSGPTLTQDNNGLDDFVNDVGSLTENDGDCPPDKPNCEPLTPTQQLGWGITLALIDVFVLGPIDIALAAASVDAALACLGSGGAACLADIPIAVLDYAMLDVTVSVNVYMYTSISNGYKSDFEWIITSNLFPSSP